MQNHSGGDSVALSIVTIFPCLLGSQSVSPSPCICCNLSTCLLLPAFAAISVRACFNSWNLSPCLLLPAFPGISAVSTFSCIIWDLSACFLLPAFLGISVHVSFFLLLLGSQTVSLSSCTCWDISPCQYLSIDKSALSMCNQTKQKSGCHAV